MILAAMAAAQPTWPPDSKPWPTIAPELMTAPVAELIAGSIWTYDGQRYQQLRFSDGRCSGQPAQCTLTVWGHPMFTSLSEDRYYMTITGDRISVAAGLGGYPPELEAEVDALARSLDVEGRLGRMQFRSAGWLIPPPADAWHLLYYVDKLEGNPKADVVLDRANRKILSLVPGVM
jgi:hypothetical protein